MHRIVADVEIINDTLFDKRNDHIPVVGGQPDSPDQAALLNLCSPVKYPLGRTLRIIAKNETVNVIGTQLGQSRFQEAVSQKR